MVEYRIEWEYLLIGYKGHGDWFHSRDKCLLETNIKIFNDDFMSYKFHDFNADCFFINDFHCSAYWYLSKIN